MALLHETEEALADFTSELGFNQGSHLTNEITFGEGRVIGEAKFNPLEHDPWDINRLSLISMITGDDFVDFVVPKAPLNMQIVACHRTTDSDPGVIAKKRRLTKSLIDELLEARAGFTDTVELFDVGPIEDGNQLNEDSEVVTTTDGIDTAETIADLCMDGLLTVVLGDFEGLPLDQMQGRFEKAVGLKINDTTDLSLKNTQRKFEHRNGGLRAVNLADKDEVELFNNRILGEHHKSLTRQMELAGFAVAKAVYDPTSMYFFNITSVDHSIAQAIDKLNVS